MKCTLTPEDRISFVYGELEAPEKEKMVAHVEACPECAAEIEAIRALRRSLPRTEAPPMPGIVRLPEPALVPATVVPLRQTTWFRALVSSAAAILILLLGARVSGLNMTVHDGALTIRFGPAQMAAQPTPVETAPDVEILLAQFKAEQQAFVQSLTDSVRIRQQQQFDQTLAALGRYLDGRRQEDLQLIASSLDEIQQIHDDRYFETNVILSQLINQMNRELLTMNAR